MADGNREWVIHIACFEMIVHGRLIQRCAVCGAKLVDTGPGSAVAVVGVTEQGEAVLDPPVTVFPTQSLVAEREGVYRKVVAPDDFYPDQGGCVSLVE